MSKPPLPPPSSSSGAAAAALRKQRAVGAPSGIRQPSISSAAAAGQASSSIAALLADSRSSLGMNLRDRDDERTSHDRTTTGGGSGTAIAVHERLTADDQYRRL